MVCRLDGSLNPAPSCRSAAGITEAPWRRTKHSTPRVLGLHPLRGLGPSPTNPARCHKGIAAPQGATGPLHEAQLSPCRRTDDTQFSIVHRWRFRKHFLPCHFPAYWHIAKAITSAPALSQPRRSDLLGRLGSIPRTPLPASLPWRLRWARLPGSSFWGNGLTGCMFIDGRSRDAARPPWEKLSDETTRRERR